MKTKVRRLVIYFLRMNVKLYEISWDFFLIQILKDTKFWFIIVRCVLFRLHHVHVYMNST